MKSRAPAGPRAATQSRRSRYAVRVRSPSVATLREPARLVDDQDVLVLVQEAEWLRAGRRRRRRELDAVVGAHRRVAPAHDGAVDARTREVASHCFRLRPEASG
jgi:hypothetical protein